MTRSVPKLSRTIAVSAVSAIVYAVLTNIRTMTSAGWHLNTFRGLGSGDQLSYLTIVANVAAGKSPDIEPFTENGHTFYPRAYYVVLGTIARWTHMRPEVAWWVVGTVLQIALVFLIGFLLVRFTGRLWSALLAPMPLVFGTFATVFTGHWNWAFDSHAKIWGSFGSLYTLNAEAAGLVLASATFLLVLAQLIRGNDGWQRSVTLVVGGAVIGAIANEHTYTFFTSLFLATYVTASYGLFRYAASKLAMVSAGLLVVVYLAGPFIATHVGALAALAFGLVPAIPGLVLLVLKHPARTIPPFVAVAIAASPSLLATFFGIRNEDPFLTYRTVSTSHLGVGLWQGAVAGLVALALIAIVGYVGIVQKRALFSGAAAGALVVWALLTTNDRWGANQEPYRFWINVFVITSIVLFPIAVFAIVEFATSRVPAENSRHRTALVRAMAISLALLSAVSLADFAMFSKNIPAIIALDGPRNDALMSIANATNGETVIADKCVTGLMFKAVTGSPVTYYNLGMAWPDNADKFEAINTAMRKGHLDESAMNALGISLIVGDDSCRDDWKIGVEDRLTVVNTARYDGGSFTLYRLG